MCVCIHTVKPKHIEYYDKHKYNLNTQAHTRLNIHDICNCLRNS